MNKAALGLAMLAFSLAGCATKDFVREYVDGQLKPVSQRVGDVEGRTGANGAEILTLTRRADATDATLTAHALRMDEISRSAEEALRRAEAAGKLAEGKLLYEVSMSDDSLHFSLEEVELSEEAQALLDAFAGKLKAENQNMYIEIQGHTDSLGSEAYNLRLGAERAESVRRYLNLKGGIPLHRMSIISYGESSPVADNRTLAGRTANRRVVLVVLK